MRVLVTGGAGFIGSHLCERLLDLGREVVCLDNMLTGRRANIEHLLGRPGFTFVPHDVAQPLPNDGRIDRIFNLACPASPVHYQRDPVKTVQTNVLGAYNVLEFARRTGARVLQASTSEVYGDPVVHPQVESYWGNVNPIGPRSCYDEGKRVAETLMMDYHVQYGVETRLARIFNTYGPRMAEDDGRVVSNFVLQALRGEQLTIYGEGRQTRSFCYVDDLVEGRQTRSFCYVDDLVEGLTRLMSFEGTDAHLPVNLGNPDEFTIRELAELVTEMIPGSGGLAFRPLPQDDPTQRQPDITRATTVLGWAPAVPLRQGLERTIADFRGRVGVSTARSWGPSRSAAAAAATRSPA